MPSRRSGDPASAHAETKVEVPATRPTVAAIRPRRRAGPERRLDGRTTARSGREATPSASVQRGRLAASSPWMNPPEHRERRGAGLARRIEGRLAELLGRIATPSAAVQHGCDAARMPGGVCPRAARMPGGVRPRAVPSSIARMRDLRASGGPTWGCGAERNARELSAPRATGRVEPPRGRIRVTADAARRRRCPEGARGRCRAHPGTPERAPARPIRQEAPPGRPPRGGREGRRARPARR